MPKYYPEKHLKSRNLRPKWANPPGDLPDGQLKITDSTTETEASGITNASTLRNRFNSWAVPFVNDFGQTLAMPKPVAPDLLPFQSHEHQVGSHTLRYLDEGSGDEALLCVHGNPTWSFYWRRIIERFSPTHRVVAVDHIGCGRSDKPSQSEFAYTLASHRNNLVSLIESLDLKRVTLVAHDWGGAIGLSSMLKCRERLHRIVLLNTGAFPPPYVPYRIAACRIPFVGTAAVRGLNMFAKAAITMAMSKNKMHPSVAAGLLAPYDSWAHRVAIDAFVKDIPMSMRHPTYKTLADLESELPKLSSTPSLLIWGMQDWCFRPECLRRFEAVWPSSRTVEISDAGHYVIEDAPKQTLQAIADFLDSDNSENTDNSDNSGSAAGDC